MKVFTTALKSILSKIKDLKSVLLLSSIEQNDYFFGLDFEDWGLLSALKLVIFSAEQPSCPHSPMKV